MIILLVEEIWMMAFTGLERTVVLKTLVPHRNNQLLTIKELQLRLQHQPKLQLPLVQLQVVLLACRHLPIFSILQLNMLAELQVRKNTHLRAVLTSEKKITEQVNNGRFSNQNVTPLMQRQRQNNGRRSERRSTLQSAVAECQMLRNF
jgi:hypothetical protein